ncbi:hypothetical protein CLOM_g17881 [Closterium sp. NIES-68]|nr:hypothetical protein CLOM_g17881 [Closterium sp. NIES-68]GJP74007.1 hypothetical protein CLOP_g4660 [Closterium sp. NIES-67]
MAFRHSASESGPPIQVPKPSRRVHFAPTSSNIFGIEVPPREEGSSQIAPDDTWRNIQERVKEAFGHGSGEGDKDGEGEDEEEASGKQGSRSFLFRTQSECTWQSRRTAILGATLGTPRNRSPLTKSHSQPPSMMEDIKLKDQS